MRCLAHVCLRVYYIRCLRIVSNVLREADVEAADVDEVVMVGGSTRIPILRAKVSDLFHGKVRSTAQLSSLLRRPFGYR